MEGAHEQCSNSEMVAAYRASDSRVGSIYRDVMENIAKDQGATEDKFVATMLAETYEADEQTLTIPGAYADDDDHAMSPQALLMGPEYDCVLAALDVPTRVMGHVSTTRALDGQQEDTWDHYQARWSYDPDDGMSTTTWVP